MKIYKVEEHLDCYCYSNDEKPLIEVREIKQTETEEILLHFNKIVFVLKGTLRLTIQNNLRVNVSNGHMIFLPANHKMRYKASTGSVILILRMKDDVQLCHTYNLNRLKNNLVKIDKPVKFETMEINPYLNRFAQGLVDTCNDGLKCRFFFKAKITEAFIILRAYYSEEQLFLFFYSYFTSDAEFAEFIRANHMNYPTVNEFASALDMTPQQFSRRFMLVFGETPYGWMQREKAHLIYGEICRSDRSVREIAEEYGFMIQPNFNRFCKKTFGMSPREIRKTRN